MKNLLAVLLAAGALAAFGLAQKDSFKTARHIRALAQSGLS